MQRPKKSEMFNVHSDSQRIVRRKLPQLKNVDAVTFLLALESSLKLPQYQPRIKTLDSFLSRVKSRQPLSTQSTVNIKPCFPDKRSTLAQPKSLPTNK